jgi:sugar/nucleoside kinase (ribokinase family)
MKKFDISIAGEINLDLVLYGLPETIPPEREMLATDFQVTLGSSSAILAHNLSTLGSRVAFITLLGTDDLGRMRWRGWQKAEPTYPTLSMQKAPRRQE